MNKRITGFSEDAINALMRYTWPGNVRELENVIERAVVLSKRPMITREDLPQHLLDQQPLTGSSLYGGPIGSAPLATASAPSDSLAWKPMALKKAIAEPEKRILLAALAANNWNRLATADQLQINRTTLYKKMKRYQIDHEDTGPQ